VAALWLVFATVVSIVGALVAVLALVPWRNSEVVDEIEPDLDAALQADLVA